MTVLFVASAGSRNNISPIIRRQINSLESHDVKIIVFTINHGWNSYLHAIFSLHRYLKKNKNIDIIHAHYGWCGIVALLANQRKMPLIVSFMGSDLVGEIKKNHGFSFWSRWFSFLNIFLARYFYDYTILKSHNLYSQIGNNNKCEIIPNGVDLDLFHEEPKHSSRKRLNFNDNYIYVLFVADPSRKEKNFALALQSVALIKSHKIEMITVNNINDKELLYYYSAADLLLLTSFYEGSPNVIKEAMACNCPIVTTDVGDVRWVIGSLAGCFITSFDPEVAAEQIRAAINYAMVNNRTSGRNRLIKLGLDSNSIAKRIVHIYSKLTLMSVLNVCKIM